MAGGNDLTQQTPPAPVVPKPQFAPPVPPEALQGPPPGTPPPAPPDPDAALIQATGDELAVAPALDAQKKQAYFCLEASHPGQSTPRADHFDLGRMFVPATTDTKGAPTCPLCRKQVTALPVDDTSKLPPSLQATSDRLAVAERQR